MKWTCGIAHDDVVEYEDVPIGFIRTPMALGSIVYTKQRLYRCRRCGRTSESGLLYGPVLLQELTRKESR